MLCRVCPSRLEMTRLFPAKSAIASFVRTHKYRVMMEVSSDLCQERPGSCESPVQLRVKSWMRRATAGRRDATRLRPKLLATMTPT